MSKEGMQGMGVPLGSGRSAKRRPLRILGMDWFHFCWLLYLGFWLIVPIEVPSRRSWLLLAFAVAVFIPLYIVTHTARSLWGRRWATLATTLLALLYVPENESAFGIYIFIASALPELVTTARGTYWLIAGECAVILAQAFACHLPSWEWSIGCGISAVTAINIQNLHTQRLADARLRMAHDEIEQLAKSAERERIARDLHDVLGHTLSLISIKSELAARMLDADPARTAQELAEIQTTARRALAEVRQTVSGYRAQGLEAEIQGAMATLAAAGVTLVERPERVPRLPPQQEASLALILRESVTNIVRHAGARSCSVVLETGAAETVLEVRDDGQGMRGPEGNGLRGMRERVRELGGTIEMGSELGTSLRVTLPRLQATAAEETQTGRVLLPLRT